MKNERIVLITLIVGLFTGVLALLSGYYSLQKDMVELEMRSRESAQKAKDAEAETAQFKQRLEDQAKINHRQILCNSHIEKAEAIDRRFSALMTNYGNGLRFLKACASGATEGGAAACVLLACAGATNSASECLAAGNDLAKITADYDTEKGLAAKDDCTLPQSAIDEYKKN